MCIDTDIYMLVYTSTKFLIQYNNTYIAIINLHACIQQFLEKILVYNNSVLTCLDTLIWSLHAHMLYSHSKFTCLVTAILSGSPCSNSDLSCMLRESRLKLDKKQRFWLADSTSMLFEGVAWPAQSLLRGTR